MNDTMVTLCGRLGGDVTLRQAGGVPVANFRVATTPRRFNKATQAWSDGDTQWYTATAWRQLAENCAESLRRGDPIVLHGRLSANTWTNRDGEDVTTMDVEVVFCGHDLSRGVTQFLRNPRATHDHEVSHDAGSAGEAGQAAQETAA